MQSTLLEPKLTRDRVLSIAEADAVAAYDNLNSFRVEIQLKSDGWHVEYLFRGEGRFHTGGGPTYIIDAETGAILDKKYYQ